MQTKLPHSSTTAPVAWLLATLGLLILAVLPWLAWRTALPIEIDTNEPWNAWWAAAAGAGQTLYPGLDSLLINNYPPLYFYLLDAAARLSGLDLITAGRLLSLLAAAAMALSTYGLLRRQWHADRLPAALATCWLLALLLTCFSRYTGMNDPQMPALAIMLAGFSLLLQNGGLARLALAVAIMVAAGFIKHSLWALPVASFLFFAFTDRGRALQFAILGGLFAASGLALCYLQWGQPCLDQLLLPRNSSWAAAVRHLPGLLWFYPVAAYALASWWRGERKPQMLLAQLLLWTAFVVNLLQRRGDGVDINAALELAVASALWVGLAAQRLSVAGPKPANVALAAAALSLPLMAATPIDALNFYRPAWRQQVNERVALFRSEVARVEAIPGNVACDRLSVCFRAGKANVYDFFGTVQKLRVGLWTEHQLQEKTAAAGIRFVTIDPRVAW